MMATPKRKSEDPLQQLRNMKHAELERRLEELHKQRAAVSDDELQDWLTDLPPLDTLILGQGEDILYGLNPISPGRKKLTFQKIKLSPTRGCFSANKLRRPV